MKKQGSQIVYSKVFLVTLAFIMVILNSFIVAALDFDNIKTYDEQTKTAVIKNNFGLGSEIARVKLNTPQVNLVPIGKDMKVAEFEIISSQYYNNVLTKLDFYKPKEGNKKILKDAKFKVKSYQTDTRPIYSLDCSTMVNGTEICNKIITGTEEYEKEVWTELNKKDLDAGVYTIGVFVDVEKGDYIDWVPTLFNNQEISEWAIYAADPQLVAYYKFNETAGLVASNAQGNSNHLRINLTSGALGTRTGKIDYALNISNRVDQYANNLSLIGTSGTTINLTYCGWYNITSAEQWDALYAMTDAGVTANFVSQFQTTTNLGFDAYASAASHLLTIDYTPYWAKWTYFCQVINSSHNTLYINGVVNQTISMGGATWSNVNRLYIGNDRIGITTRGLNGLVDEFAIWNRSLSPADIIDLYNGGLGNQYPFTFENISQTLSTPNNKTYLYGYNSTHAIIPINVSYLPANTTSPTCYYNSTFNTTATYVTCNALNNLITTNIFGRQIIYTYVQDALGNIRTNSTLVSIIKPTYNLTSLILSTENFGLNISPIDSASISTYVFNYNGTSYTPTIITDGSNNLILNNEVTIPITSNGTVPFYWNLTFSVGQTDYKVYNQTITGINIDNCINGKTLLFNLTNYDQDNFTRLLNNNYFNVQVRIGDESLTSYKQYNNNFSNINHANVCLDINLTRNYRMDYIIQWNANDAYYIQYYNVQNYTLNNATDEQNISLYNLAEANGQVFQINVKDENFIPLTGVVVRINRQYLQSGQSYIVEAPLTDLLGSTSAHLVLNDQVYNVYITRNGQIIGSFLNQLPYCNTALTDCVINYNLQAESTSFIDEADVLYTPTYSDSDRTYRVSFQTATTLPATIGINGTIYENGIESLVCTNTLTSSVGELTCVVPASYVNKTVNFEVWNGATPVFTDSIRTGNSKSFLGTGRYILAGLLLPLALLIGISSTPIALIMFLFGFILISLTFLFDNNALLGSTSLVMWVLVAGIILLIKVTRGGVKNG